MIKDIGQNKTPEVERKTRQLSILLKPSTYKAIKKLSRKQHWSVNSTIGFLLEKGIENKVWEDNSQ